jgi:hypothetical protein
MNMSFTEARERNQIFSRFLGPRGRTFVTATKGDMEKSGCNMALFDFMLRYGYFSPIAKDLYGLTWIGAMDAAGLMGAMQKGSQSSAAAAEAVGETFFDPLVAKNVAARPSADTGSREEAERQLAWTELALAKLRLREERADEEVAGISAEEVSRDEFFAGLDESAARGWEAIETILEPVISLGAVGLMYVRLADGSGVVQLRRLLPSRRDA